MHLKLATNVTRISYQALSSSCLKRGFTTRSHTADPDIHSGQQKPGYTNTRVSPEGTSRGDSDTNTKFAETDKEEGIFESPKSPYESSPKLKSNGVNQRLDPNIQQKRKHGTKAALEDVSCAGLDGTPWPEEKERNKEEQNQDNKEYYKDNKASPLSEIEFVDTRKPVSRVMHGTADAKQDGDVIGWLPEQVETAEETLLRAAEMWRQRAMRGDPHAPHSRVLRALRGEDF
ncbi:uncharacterized protein LOC123891134 [Trifolium pratense]|uniref:Uncharacterized protein n=1 Tax=Trifolium pratense TaxID=57577 RepID=A0ACB0II02_TRIPR|nr:uncharacterized protein LOC123891134 [Trifolium pratense]CAJ2631953.1 unnamed protein product [Trifolium pratense]